MKHNNLLVGIAILLAATACTQGRYLGVNGDDIAKAAEGHHGSEAWATNKKKDNFEPGQHKCNKFVYDVLREVSATAPTYSGSGAFANPVTAGDWANVNYSIDNWQHLGTNVTCQRGDVLSNGFHCGFAVRDRKSVV